MQYHLIGGYFICGKNRNFVLPFRKKIMMNIRVAIFEDNKLIRDAYTAILDGTSGYQCVGAYPDCNDLKFVLHHDQPDVILMDIGLPGMDGINATRLICKEFPGIRILIQTVFEDDDKIFAAICAGASGYILKSNGMLCLLEAVSEVYNGGAPMSPAIASRVLQLFQKYAQPHQAPEEIELSQREKDILKLMVEGKDFHTIAEKNFIGYETVRTHVKKIYRKLHVASATEAVVKALRQGLV